MKKVDIKADKEDPGGNLIITFSENVEARYLKVHSNYDDRNRDGSFKDLSEFQNQLGQLVLVYKRLDKVTEEYGYDSVGNREWRKITGSKTAQTNYGYYPAGDGSLVRTNRLLEAKTVFDGQKVTDAFAYQYDRAGNMVTKGNIYQIRDAATDAVLTDHESLQGVGARSSAVSVNYIATDGLYVKYWEYEYNVRNRMECVWKNGQEVARYSYDYAGKRSRSEEGGEVLHFVYGLGGVLVYQADATGAQNDESYVHAVGLVMAQVGGIVGKDGEVLYYHHDNLGSTILMTDLIGKQMFKQDYAPFGQTLNIAKTPLQKQPNFKYTGQREAVVTGLYYYKARYYDSATGRFVSEDPLRDGINWYVYALANPLKYINPTGNANEISMGGGINYRDFILEINPFHWDTLELGSTGAQVTELQHVLNYLGYKTDIDGIFGEGTLKIIKEFQRFYNIPSDGVIGQTGRTEFVKALGISETIMELREVDVDFQSNEIYPLMQVEAAQAFQDFLEEVRTDEIIPTISFGEIFRPQRKQAHFRAIFDDDDKNELKMHVISSGVNPAGRSFHEVGLAFDVNIGSVNADAKKKLISLAINMVSIKLYYQENHGTLLFLEQIFLKV